MPDKIKDNMRIKFKKALENTRPRHIITVFTFSLVLALLVTYYRGRADELFPDYIRNVHIQNFYNSPENIVSAGEYIKVVFDLKEDVTESAMVNKILDIDAYTYCDNTNLIGNGFKSCFAYIVYDVNTAKASTNLRATFSLGLETLDELNNPLSIFVDKTSDDSYVDLDRPTTAYYYEMGDVSISSNNVSDKSVGEVGNIVTLNFAMSQDVFYSDNKNLIVKILDKTVEAACYDSSPISYNKNYFKNIFSYLFLTSAEAAISYPIKCSATTVLSQEDIDKYKSSNIKFEISFNTWNIRFDEIKDNFSVNTTNDLSFVQIKDMISSIKDYSKYISNVHIESDNVSSSTLAVLNDKVTLTYELDNTKKYEKNIVKILNKEVNPVCKVAKDVSPKSFNLKCTATIEIDQADIDVVVRDIIIPFILYIEVFDGLGKSQNFKIEETDDQSFVKLLARLIIKADSASNQSAEPENAVPTPAAVPVPAEVSNIIPGSVIMNPNPSISSNNNKASLVKICPIIAPNRFYKLGSKAKDVLIIKREINENLGTNMKLTDIFDKELEINLKKWQDKHSDIVLIPWGTNSATGYFYKTSNWAMNYLSGCTIPKYVLEKYKK